MKAIYSESDLIEPALSALLEHGEMTTSVLHDFLRAKLEPEGDDLKILSGRNDDRFSQKVRNLKSHDTLENLGLATYSDEKWKISENGEKFLKVVQGATESLRKQGFTEKQRSVAIEQNLEKLFIEEGDKYHFTSVIRKRSRKLRSAAIKKYSDADGKIECVACEFEGGKYYGNIGLGLIEIHHIEPICEIEGTQKQSIQKALEKVVPLCPNCHSIVHKDNSRMLSIEELKTIINAME